MMKNKQFNSKYRYYLHTPINELRKICSNLYFADKEWKEISNYNVLRTVLKDREGYAKYPEPIKNKDKREFDWDYNKSCIDFHLITNDNEDNYYYSGSMCYQDFEYYNDDHEDEELECYYISDFKKESKKVLNAFMNRKNKKQYEIDEHIGWVPITLWNYTTDDFDKLYLDLNLTYCP